MPDRFLYLEPSGGPPEQLLITGFSGTEALSELFRFDIDVLADVHVEVQFDQLLGLGVSFGVNVLPNNASEQRDFHGVCTRVVQGGRDQNYTRYQLTVVPTFWFLTQRFQSRIFQKKSVPDILKDVLTGVTAEYKLTGEYKPRDYCVQYQESDFHFASRLMEEEGIFYFFRFEAGMHTLVVADNPTAHKPIQHGSTLYYEELSGGERTEERIAEWEKAQDLRSGKCVLWDHSFGLPHKHLDAEQMAVTSVDAGQITHKFRTAGNDKLELYEYPGLYAQRFDVPQIQDVFADNKRTVKIRMEQAEQPMLIIRGAGNCRQMSAGFKFSLQHHFNADDDYVLVSVSHHAEEGDYRSQADTSAAHYGNHFTCIPLAMPYRPLRKTPRPFIRGCQTAVVVGPAGEEIYTDEYGRVKVQFHWDREGKYDAKSSCWIRVGTTWAGKNWGAISIPRIGHEVIVDFLEGDPDRPIITGSVYNLDMMPSYPLPGNKTRSGIKTRSTIGGGGFNEIRFEDKKGSEQIFIHGEKDLDIRIKKDSREWIGNSTSLIVKKDRYEEIGSDSHVYIKRDLNEKVGRDHSLNVLGKEAVQITGSKSLKVTGAVADEFGSDHSEKTTGDYYLHAKNIVLEADVQLTISVGGNFVTIGPAGVTIVGTMVMINSGGAAGQGSAGSIVPPSDPKAPDVADDATPGGDKQYSGVGPGATKGIPSITGKGHAASPAPPDAPRHDPSDPANQEKKHYIEIELHDDEQLPVPGEPYEIILPDGSTVASGTTDEKGRARVENIDAGHCRVRFPRRDQTMVKPK